MLSVSRKASPNDLRKLYELLPQSGNSVIIYSHFMSFYNMEHHKGLWSSTNSQKASQTYHKSGPYDCNILGVVKAYDNRVFCGLSQATSSFYPFAAKVIFIEIILFLFRFLTHLCIVYFKLYIFQQHFYQPHHKKDELSLTLFLTI